MIAFLIGWWIGGWMGFWLADQLPRNFLEWLGFLFWPICAFIVLCFVLWVNIAIWWETRKYKRGLTK